VSTRARPCSYIITPRRSIAGRAESGRTTRTPPGGHAYRRGSRGGEQEPTQLPDELTQVPEIPIESVDTERFLTLARQTDEYDRPLYALGTRNERSGTNSRTRSPRPRRLGTPRSGVSPTSRGCPTRYISTSFTSRCWDGSRLLITIPPRRHRSGRTRRPRSYELGWNDVVTVDPGNVVHVIAHFGEFKGLFSDQTGDYMWHCHMIEHEDHDMMRPFRFDRPMTGWKRVVVDGADLTGTCSSQPCCRSVPHVDTHEFRQT